VPSIFTRIIQGELPGRFVWRDDRCVAFLTVAPTAAGHTLVVPIEEIDHWIDLPGDLAAHMWEVAGHVGRALQLALSPRRVGVLVAGDEVPHTHVHLIPFHDLSQLDLTTADNDPDPHGLDVAAERIRDALRANGQEAAGA
jgi:diadenosine tetraphosphate (Ap4A) HIT family hydrolase